MKNILVSIALLLGLSATAPTCRSESVFVPLPKGDQLLLPLQLGITNHMIYAPKKKPVDHPKDLIFLVDQDGRPWLSDDGKILINLLGSSLLTVDKRYQDAAIVGGSVVLCADQSMGTLDDPSPEEKKKNGLLMKFHPRVALPYKSMRIFAGEGDALYFVGKNPVDGKDELFILAPNAEGKGEFVKLVAIKEGISAVAGDGSNTFFASGSLIVKIGPARKKMERVIKLAETDPIKELAYSAKAGLFYSTDKGVAYVGAKRPLVILKAPGVSIRMRKDSLFVLFVKEQEVMEFGGVSGFSKLLGKK